MKAEEESSNVTMMIADPRRQRLTDPGGEFDNILYQNKQTTKQRLKPHDRRQRRRICRATPGVVPIHTPRVEHVPEQPLKHQIRFPRFLSVTFYHGVHNSESHENAGKDSSTILRSDTCTVQRTSDTSRCTMALRIFKKKKKKKKMKLKRNSHRSRIWRRVRRKSLLRCVHAQIRRRIRKL